MSLIFPESTSTNQPPLLVNPILEQKAVKNQSFSFTVPRFTFADRGDNLTYTATLGDGSPLPSWLDFDQETLTLSGTPAGIGNLNITITATDSTGNSVSDTFVLAIALSNTSINGYAHNIEIAGNYAYVATGWAGWQIFNISNPNAPTLVASYDTSGYTRDVVVVGNYAYVADSDAGIQIFNISNPNTPILVGSYNTPGLANGIAVVGNYAYIADWDAGVQIIDISNPSTPTFVGSYDTPGAANSIIVVGNYAYVADAASTGVQILNISNPNAPTLASSYDTPDFPYGITVVGDYAYVLDGNSGVLILNISNPNVPTLVGSYDLPNPEIYWAKGIKVVGNYAYITTYESGVQILDISNPSAPTFVGSYNTDAANDIEIVGDYIYVADGYSIKVLDRVSWDGTPSDTEPVVANAIASQTAYRNQSFIFTIPDYTFADPGDSITYSATLGDGSTLPSWLSFNPTTRTFSGTPTQTGNLNLKITATDSSDKSVSDTFLLSIFTSRYDTFGETYDIAIAGNYAYLADGYSGIQIIDITNPNSPTLISSYDTADQAYGIAIAGNYVYVADGDAGIQILDISNPNTPTFVSSYNTSGTANSIVVVGDYAYLADGNAGLLILDISNPNSPTVVGSYDTSGSAEDITVIGNYAYIADSWDGVKIFDISNPSAASLVGSANSFANAYGITVVGDYAYVADGDAGIQILNISDRTAPNFLSNYDTPFGAFEIAVVGNYAYVANYNSGVIVLDISDRSQPTLVTQYETNGSAYGIATSGNYAYIADGYSGVQVIQLQDSPPVDDVYEENDTQQTAYDLTTFEDTKLSNLQGTAIQKVGDKDWYKIEVSPGEEILSVKTTYQPGLYADFILRDANGNQIGYANSGGSDNEYTHSITTIVNPGIYYIEVIPSDNAGTGITSQAYDLEWSDQAIAEVAVYYDAYENNDTLATAYDLTPQKEQYTFPGLLLDEDWYKIQAAPGEENLQIYLEIDNVTNPIDLNIYNSAGNLVTGLTLENFFYGNAINTNLPSAGTYYIQLKPYGLGNFYSFLRWNTQNLDGIIPPQANNDSITISEDTPTIIDILANDSNVNVDLLSLSFAAPPAYGTLTIDNNGTLTNINDDVITYTPNLNFHGIDSFTYTINNAQGETSTATVTIQANSVNDVPTLTSVIPDQSATEDTPFTFQIPANTFIDVDTGDSLTYSAIVPSWLSFNPATRTFSGTPTNSDLGIVNIQVTATDQSGASVDDTFTLTVVNTNDAPILGIAIADQTTASNTPFTFQIPLNTFSDIDTGDTLTYSAKLVGDIPLPTWLIFNPTTRTFSGTPGNADVGTLNITVQAIDTSNASIGDSFVLTITNLINNIVGTSGNNTLTGTPNNDNIQGLGGNDIISGLAGNDTLDGGSGADTMNGGLGDDTYIVDNSGDKVFENPGEGTDTVRTSVSHTLSENVENLILTGTGSISGTGNALNNIITGNSGGNTLSGKAGDDTLNGEGGNDTFKGEEGNDILNGGAGNDTLDGGVGDDVMIGGTGNDTYYVDSSTDEVTETFNAGTDLVNSSVSLTLGDDLENLTLIGSDAINGTGNGLKNTITGNNADNSLFGGNNDDILRGNAGNDTLDGGAGNDTLDGGVGDDLMIGGAGNDTYYVDSINDQITELLNEGTDSVNASVSWTLGENLENLILTGSSAIDGTGNGLKNTITGNSADNSLFGDNNDDTLRGNAGNDTLDGGAGNDSLDGGIGNDVMIGGAGNDTYYVDSINDQITELANEGTDTVRVSFSWALSDNLENLTLTGSNAIDGTGNELKNTITGNSADNSLSGGDNDDTLRGNAGNDTLDGGAGNDSLDGGIDDDVMIGGAGNDTYYVNSSNDQITEAENEGTDTVRTSVTRTLGDNLENLILTGSSAIDGTGNTLKNNITGNAANNSLSGGDDNDTISGGDGNDTLNGEQGNDTLTGGNGNDILVGGLGNDKLTGGAGNDQFVFDSIGEGIDTITDFSSTSDVLVVGNLLNSLNYIGINPIADGYIRGVQSGLNTLILIDTDGNSNGASFSTLVTLNNFNASNFSQNNLIF